MKKIIITVIAFLITVSGIFTADYKINNNFISVKTSVIKKDTIDKYIKAEGTAKEQNKREINIELPLTVKKIYIEEGEQVKKGQVLFKLSDSVLLNKIEMMTLKQGKADDITENLISKIKNYKKNIESPINGIITKINITEGKEIFTEIPSVVISDLDNQIIKVKIKESIYPDIFIGQKTIIEGKSLKNNINGEVVKIYPSFETDEGKRGTAYIIIDVKAESYKDIKPETNFTVSFLKENKRKTITIPFDAIMFNEDRPYVFIDNFGFAVKRYINIGEEYDTKAEVKDGVYENEKIILNPKLQKIKNGDKLSEIK